MDTTRPTFAFERNDSDEEQGIAHSDIEQFKDRPYGSLARECGQNSNDAAATRDPRVHPVKVDFRLIEIRQDDYPAKKEHLQALSKCKELAKTMPDDIKRNQFFDRAIHVLNQSTIPVLLISDTETTGLRGPANEHSPFKALLKGKGTSSGKPVDGGGNYGIGKGAAFAASDLYTVFYSTLYFDTRTQREMFLAQGKTRLTNFTDTDGNPRKSDGYWGYPSKFSPIEDPSQVPSWLRRDEIGTTVAVAGFREKENWQYELAMSLLTNYFAAISRGEIEFSINNGEISLTNQSIEELFSHPRIADVVAAEKFEEEFEIARNLFRCLTSASAIITTIDVPEVGKFNVRVLLEDGLPRVIKILRNGMVITDSLEEFGQRFARFPNHKDFIAIVETADTTASSVVRRLENPEHNRLSAERIVDPIERKKIKKSMEGFAQDLKALLKKVALPELQERSALDELAEFFADNGGNGNNAENAKENPERHVYRLSTRDTRQSPRAKTRSKGLSADGGGGGGGGGGDGGGDGDGGTGKAKGKGTGGSGTPGDFRLQSIRNFFDLSRDNTKRVLRFTPGKSGKARVTVWATGVNEQDALSIVGTDKGTIDSGDLLIDLRAGCRESVTVTFRRPYAGPIELGATGNKRDKK